MSLSSDLLNILACPKCKGQIEFDEAENKIICHACQLRFPVRDDIPVMLIDEAEAL